MDGYSRCAKRADARCPHDTPPTSEGRISSAGPPLPATLPRCTSQATEPPSRPRAPRWPVVAGRRPGTSTGTSEPRTSARWVIPHKPVADRSSTDIEWGDAPPPQCVRNGKVGRALLRVRPLRRPGHADPLEPGRRPQARLRPDQGHRAVRRGPAGPGNPVRGAQPAGRAGPDRIRRERRSPAPLQAHRVGAEALRSHLATQRRIADLGLRRLAGTWGPA